MPKRWRRIKAPENLRIVDVISCRPRWKIINILAKGPKTTAEIQRKLMDEGFLIPKSTIYYHLTVLRESGVVEVKEYRESGQGAPEKVWDLKASKIIIDLRNGTFHVS